MVGELSPEGLHQWLQSGKRFELLDVRDSDERAIAAIAGARAIPMAEVPSRLNELPANVPIVVLCHHGQRSARVAALLSARGFGDVYNVEGGIEAYRQRVDPTLAAY